MRKTRDLERVFFIICASRAIEVLRTYHTPMSEVTVPDDPATNVSSASFQVARLRRCAPSRRGRARNFCAQVQFHKMKWEAMIVRPDDHKIYGIAQYESERVQALGQSHAPSYFWIAMVAAKPEQRETERYGAECGTRDDARERARIGLQSTERSPQSRNRRQSRRARPRSSAKPEERRAKTASTRISASTAAKAEIG